MPETWTDPDAQDIIADVEACVTAPNTRQAQAAISEIPASCTCTWSWGPPPFRWERIGAKESCPWHRLADSAAALAKDGRWNL